MIVPLKWLKRYVNIDMDIEKFTSAMVMTGLEVEEYRALAPNIQNVFVGKIEEIEKHPGADRLLVCKLNMGNETLQIVTGAPNVFVGAVVPVAVDGAVLPHVTIKTTQMRGVTSQGMLVSGGELNLEEIGRAHV